MQALAVESQGSAPMLVPLETPNITSRKVRLKVSACALNFADLLMIDGRYQENPPFPLVPGMEISGKVIEIGTEVTRFNPGDSVVAFAGHGGLASETLVDEARVLHRPETMDDVTGAAFMVAYGTSHLALTRVAQLRQGEKLVVLGAGGGVGLTAVEVGAALGAEIIAVARGAKKLAAAKEAGAHHLIDSNEVEDLRGEILKNGPVNVVYDAVGGAQGEAAMRCLAPEGRHLLIGFASGDLPQLKPNHMLVKNISAQGFYWGGYLAFDPKALTDSLAELITWHAEGKIHPRIDRVLPLGRANEALDLLRARKVTGKIVVTP